MKALVINDTRSHYGDVIDVKSRGGTSYYDEGCDLWYDARELQFLADRDFDWQSFRREAAKDIMCAFITGKVSIDDSRQYLSVAEKRADKAVEYADALIERLKKDK